jgi:hypothetical protein
MKASSEALRATILARTLASFDCSASCLASCLASCTGASFILEHGCALSGRARVLA